MKIRHLVHSCLLIDVAGRTLLIDPGNYSADAVRGLDPGELARLDAVVITHQHPDHVDRGLLADVLAAAPDATVLAEPQTAEQIGDLATAIPLPAGHAHEFEPVGAEPPLRVAAVGGQHAIIHPDIPRVGNSGLVLTAGDGPRLGITGDSLEPVEEFHGIDALAFAVVAPWSKMTETIDFLRRVRPRLALPVHDAVASQGGRAIYLKQSTDLAPDGTEVRDWPEDRTVTL